MSDVSVASRGSGSAFVDSWIWLEYALDGRYADEAREVVRLVEDGSIRGHINPLVTAEVAYRIENELGGDARREILDVIDDLDVESIPLADAKGHGKACATVRNQSYSQSGGVTLSYADAMHVVSAVSAGCDVLYTGDPDFAPVEEVEVAFVGHD
ncbi:type II toxin-antitoxin system VapC family toxin [Halobium palmae]|uniref:Type II toxin-antitoxin system VapC family toxin n=1 Tax=Halobium palmae TaxID=1776492 RepID=A0ABD5RZL4_9EURY